MVIMRKPVHFWTFEKTTIFAHRRGLDTSVELSLLMTTLVGGDTVGLVITAQREDSWTENRLAASNPQID